MQVIIITLSTFRYIKFKNLKSILLNNLYENICEEEQYLPKEFFNNIVLGVSINILFIYIFFLIFPKNCHVKKIEELEEEMGIENGNLNFCNDDLSKDIRIFYLIIPFIITSIIFLVVDFIKIN